MKKWICLGLTLALLGLAGCSGEVNPDEPSQTTEGTAVGTTEATTMEPSTTEETTTTEAPPSTSKPTATNKPAVTSNTVKFIIDYPIKKVTVLKFHGSSPTGEVVKVMESTNELNAFKDCMKSEFWRTAEEVGDWPKYSPRATLSTEFILFVEGNASQVSVLHLWFNLSSSWLEASNRGGAVSIAHLGNSSLSPEQYPLSANLSNDDFSRYFVASETYKTLYALCE
ncbi:MAG: hypothetical protein FWE98_01345 [Oscillospiraceae bacterium]|nr:hypothetical protein [Oscillospiraceae bacterium]